MNYPLSTGQAAHALSSTEPRLSELVRRGKIRPKPRIIAGRRLWEHRHMLQAARHLDLISVELLATLREIKATEGARS